MRIYLRIFSPALHPDFISLVSFYFYIYSIFNLPFKDLLLLLTYNSCCRCLLEGIKLNRLTDQTDDVKCGVGQDGGVDFVQTVVRSFSAVQRLSGYAENIQKTHREYFLAEILICLINASQV